MHKILLTIFFATLLLCASALFAAPPHTMSLKECYNLALKHNETVPIAQQDINLVKAKYQSILGAILPKISVGVTELVQDEATVSSVFNRVSTPELAVTLTQPIFHGLIDFYAIRSNKSELKQKQFLLEDAKLNLYWDVASTFYLIAGIERHLQTTHRMLAVLRAQNADLQHRRDLGKIRESEFISQKTEIALLEAGAEKLKGDRLVAYEIMTFLTGQEEQLQIAVQNPLAQKLQNLNTYLSYSSQRPNVMAAKEQIDINKQTVKMAKGMLLPAADLAAGYYPYRTGISDGIDWDVQFNLSLPVFNLTNLGKIKEAKSVDAKGKLQTQRLQRSAENDVKKYYASLRSNLSQLGKYQSAAALSQKNYELQRADAQNGLVSHQDVLQAERSWFLTLTARDTVQVQAWMDLVNLQISAGVLP